MQCLRVGWFLDLNQRGLEQFAQGFKLVHRGHDQQGHAINFVAATRGRKHQCYITTVMGAVSSSAICSGANSVNSASAGSSAGNSNCNALLSAAGQCR